MIFDKIPITAYEFTRKNKRMMYVILTFLVVIALTWYYEEQIFKSM